MQSGYLFPTSAIFPIPFIFKSYQGTSSGDIYNIKLTVIISDHYWDLIWRNFLIKDFILTDNSRKTIINNLYISGAYRGNNEVEFRHHGFINRCNISQLNSLLPNIY